VTTVTSTDPRGRITKVFHTSSESIIRLGKFFD
jgi:hypothetical protein